MDVATLMVMVLAGAILLLITRERPELWLAVGCVLKFSGDSYLTLSTIGSLMIVGAFVLALLHPGLGGWIPRGLGWLPVLVPILLAARSFSAQQGADPTDFLMCSLAAAVAVWCVRAGRPLPVALAVAGVIYLVISLQLGTTDPTGSRFQGVSGNPNRLVGALILTLPFILHAAVRTRRLWVSLVGLGAVALVVSAVLRTQSSQGLAALVVLLVGVAYVWVKQDPRRFPFGFLAACLAGIMAWFNKDKFEFGTGEIVAESAEDVESWSGRLPLFGRAWEVILENPWVGSGVSHFDAGGVVDRSSHNVTLSIGVISGVPVMTMWIVFLVGALWTARKRMIQGDYWAIAALAAAVLSLTQTLELLPLFWLVLAVVVIPVDSRAGEAVHPNDPAEARRPTGATLG